VFIAIGRPGEPYRQPLHVEKQRDDERRRARRGRGSSDDGDAPPTDGVEINRYTTTDFRTWSDPVTVLWLPNGSGGALLSDRAQQFADRWGWRPEDGAVWTPKSIDRNPANGQYLFFASWGSAGHHTCHCIHI
jgi:hypothetical protein